MGPPKEGVARLNGVLGGKVASNAYPLIVNLMTDTGDFDPNVAYRPKDPEDFASAVAHALQLTYGHSVEPDSKGGYRILTGSAGMVITPRPEGVLSVVSSVVTGMTNPAAAEPILKRLNDRVMFVRFQILGDTVEASCDAPALPFVPQHLYTLINTAGHALDLAGLEITEIAGGHTLLDVLQATE